MADCQVEVNDFVLRYEHAYCWDDEIPIQVRCAIVVG